MPAVRDLAELCAVDECDRGSWCQSMCEKHYRRVQRGASADTTPLRQLVADLARVMPCVAHGCDRPLRARGMCNMHLLRVRDGGSFARVGREPVRPAEKACLGCARSLPVEMFMQRPDRPERRVGRCADCTTVRGRAGGSKSWRRYDLTREQYDELVAAHQGCAICGKEPSKNRNGVLDIDHCHASGKVRGLLCTSCNTALGQFGDDPERLEAAAAYLRERG